MTLYYMDELGEVSADVDGDSVTFCNGECYFSSYGEEYRIPNNALIEIVNL